MYWRTGNWNHRKLTSAITNLLQTGEAPAIGVLAQANVYLGDGYADAWAMENLCGLLQVTWEGQVRQDPDYAEFELLAADTVGNMRSVKETDIDSPLALAPYGPFTTGMPTGTTKALLRFNHTLFEDTNNAMGYVPDVTVDLIVAQVPYVNMDAEASVYHLDCTLTNNETEQSLSLTYFMTINDVIRVDCEEHTVELLGHGLNLYPAMELDVFRRDWLTVEPGNNEFEFSDGNLGTIVVIIRHRDRWL